MAVTMGFSFCYDPDTKYTVELSIGSLSICMLEKDDRQGTCYVEVERTTIEAFLLDSKGNKILPQFFKAVEFVEKAYGVRSEDSVVAKSSPCTEVFVGDNGGSYIYRFVLRDSRELEFEVKASEITSITFYDDAIPAFFDAVNKAKNIVDKSANYFLTGLDIPR
jgi:hypothetical protein